MNTVCISLMTSKQCWYLWDRPNVLIFPKPLSFFQICKFQCYCSGFLHPSFKFTWIINVTCSDFFETKEAINCALCLKVFLTYLNLGLDIFPEFSQIQMLLIDRFHATYIDQVKNLANFIKEEVPCFFEFKNTENRKSQICIDKKKSRKSNIENKNRKIITKLLKLLKTKFLLYSFSIL